MYIQNEYVAVQLNRDAHDAAFREAENRRMLRKAGLLGPNGVTRMIFRASGAAGRALVALGQRLVRVEAASFRSTAGLSTGD